jgi:hypothetical protein
MNEHFGGTPENNAAYHKLCLQFGDNWATRIFLRQRIQPLEDRANWMEDAFFDGCPAPLAGAGVECGKIIESAPSLTIVIENGRSVRIS